MTQRDSQPLVAGIFVGGRGSRMGGIAKGLLATATGEPIVVRTLRLLEALRVRSVVISSHAQVPTYREANLGLEIVEDDPSAQGPLAGLLALLRHAPSGAYVVAVACDMPLLSLDVLRRLIEAPAAPIVAARRQHWEPLFARYEVASVRPLVEALAARGVFKLQTLMEEGRATALSLSAEEEASLVDWDTPEDIPSGLRVR